MQTLRIFIVLLFLNTVSCLSASIANNYKISNYSASDYSATLQNWDICLDKNGLVLVANNGGMLLYNGSNWKFLELQNKESIRAIKKIGDKIYTSGDKNIGYWQRDNTGNYRYTDLINNRFRPAEQGKQNCFVIVLGLIVHILIGLAHDLFPKFFTNSPTSGQKVHTNFRRLPHAAATGWK